MGHDFKIPGLIRAGFQYQDLVAIEVLIDFYRDPQRYAWVQLDAEDEPPASGDALPSFRSIDDVVACRPDGTYELTQVKFAADPSAANSALSWSWLLAQRGRGTSLLQKWARTAAAHRGAGTLARSMLKTDRAPDADFAACLVGPHIAWSQIPAGVRAQVEGQLGSVSAAEAFFADFEFLHSLPRLDDLEEQLWARVASDTDRGGWSLFRHQVERWSTRKGQPQPDGRIRYLHLRQAFAVERPRPIPQDFRVPRGYRVPNDDFDAEFRAVAFRADGLSVLWGPPGRGKSTYLSHCVAKTDQRTAVCIRHHYFLSLDDRSEGRFHFHAISHSLHQQLRDTVPSFPTDVGPLGESLEMAAKLLASEGRRLVVVVDGLDHVWREHRDRNDMEELFAALLPLPENVSLVVGTQKIDAAQLPGRLLRALPPEEWTELPLMSLPSVRAWVGEQDQAGRLNVDEPDAAARRRAVRRVADALHDISQGLPLHLIYSFESLTRTGEPVDADDVHALPACPTGDIRDYYRAFWDRSGPKARAILHVLAGLEFGPPPSALHACFGLSDEAFVAFAEISHLLVHRETGVQPFHDSLFAFARELPQHDALFRANVPDVLNWLRSDRAGYWRWAWLWVTERQLGDSSKLLSETTRSWAIDGIAAGYPLSQVLTILGHAERAAFEILDLERLLALRSLRVRAMNAPEFQMQDWPLIPEAAISLSPDPTAHALLRTDLVNTPTGLFSFIVRTSDPSIRVQVADAAIAELNRRILQARGDQVIQSDHQRSLATAIVEVVAARGLREDVPRVLAFAGRRDGEGLVAAYARAARLAGNSEIVLETGRRSGQESLAQEVLTTLCLEGLRPSTVVGLKGHTHPALVCLERAAGGQPPRVRTRRDMTRLFPKLAGEPGRFYEGTAGALREGFFAALAAALSGRTARGWMRAPAEAHGLWLTDAIAAFEEVAEAVAASWRQRGRWLSLGEVYAALALSTPDTRDFDDQRRLIAVRLAFRDIAFDLCLIALGLNAQVRIGLEDLASARTSAFWLDDLWVAACTNRRVTLHTSEAAAALIDEAARQFASQVTEFMERADLAAQLALFAIDHDLRQLADRELRRAIDCMLGYGWRKDLFALEVLDSLSLMARLGHPEAPGTILGLAAAFTEITEYTDGDETNHVRSSFYEALAEHFPDRVPACYTALIRETDWHYAEGLAVAFAKHADLETPTGRALLETYLPLGEAAAVESIGGPARPLAQAALEAIQRRTGRTRPAAGRERYPSSSSSIDEADPKELPEPTSFAPERLSDFVTALNAVRGFDVKKGHVARWLRHWEVEGRGDEALDAFQAALDRRGYRHELEEALDAAFNVALRVRGRTRALPFLVQAQVRRHGWQRWYTSAVEADRRLKTYAQHYPGQWREFIRATAESPTGPRGKDSAIVIGLSRLVTFLVEMGEIDEAWRCTREMARIFREELDGQPLAAPAWAL